jgi:sugar transferase (PEP-CTERM system associated)
MIQIFRVFIPASVIGLILSEVALILACYILGSWLAGILLSSDFSLTFFLIYDDGWVKILVVVVCIVAGLYFQDLYSHFRVKSVVVLIQQLCLVVGFAFLFQALLSYLRLSDWTLPRWGMIFGSGLTLVLIPGWRVFYSRVLLRALRLQTILFLGASPVARQIAAHTAEHPELGYRVLGYIDCGDVPEDENLPAGKVIGRLSDFSRVAAELKPGLVVVGLRERRPDLPMNEMLHLRFSGIPFEEAVVTFENLFGRVLTKELRPARLVFSSDLGPSKGSLFWHSAYSIPVGAVLFLLFSPIMLIVAIAVKLSSPGPVLHRQVRVGLNDSVFTVYKFRSMRVNAEAATGPVWAQKGDPRVTPVGKWLRRLRLDELPQLFNVLKGDMSIVGPRPERPEFVQSLIKQIPYYSYRHCVRPGITGWAQINYKYGSTLEDTIMKLEYDLYYIKNLALSLDLYIIFHTLKVMLFSETAQ